MTLELTDIHPVDRAEEILTTDALRFLEQLHCQFADRRDHLDRRRDDVSVTAEQLLDIASAKGNNTDTGLRNNLYVALANTAAWLSGNGAVAIHNLMEDAATAEISRAQVWQQIKNHTVLADTGDVVSKELVAKVIDEEVERLRAEVSKEDFERHYLPAKDLIASSALDDDFVDFLALPAYERVV